MIKNKILDYVSNSPYNTNRAVLEGMLDNLEGSSGGSGGTTEEWFNDGNTHIWITLHEGRTSPILGVCLKGKTTVTVDWGDGTTPDVLTGTNVITDKWTPTHEYAKPGNYVITLTTDGEIELNGTSDGSCLLRYASSKDNRSYGYFGAIRKIEIGNGVTAIGSYAFKNCYSLRAIAIPEGGVEISSYAFQNCYSIENVVIPYGSEAVRDQTFQNCYSLASVVIPDSVKSIGDNVFYCCYYITSITIPNGVESIGVNAFYNCYSVRYYDFTKHSAVPTLSAISAFTGIAADCEIRVPAALYDEWIAATNWTTYASKIVAV